MRVAVCVSGILRELHPSFESLNEHIVKPTNADVFIHTWDYSTVLDDKWGSISPFKGKKRERLANKIAPVLTDCDVSPEDLRRSVETYFKPKTMVVDNHTQCVKKGLRNDRKLDWYVEKIKGDVSHVHVPVINTVSAHYSKLQSHLMMEQYEKKLNFKYDIVIRYRTEILFCESVAPLIDNHNLCKNKNIVVIPDSWYGAIKISKKHFSII